MARDLRMLQQQPPKKLFFHPQSESRIPAKNKPYCFQISRLQISCDLERHLVPDAASASGDRSRTTAAAAAAAAAALGQQRERERWHGGLWLWGLLLPRGGAGHEIRPV